ncbi:replicative DNA helicase [Carnimonas bestiolae]|uniref:replicative DNA helicase n=1 Tax=Carnimonas bestiolae TaxID=3402172 RepID=UPI003EDC929A
MSDVSSIATIPVQILPPHSIEAEQSVLGGLMLDNTAWDDVNELVSKECFYHPQHRTLFGVMASLMADNQPVDVVTVSEAMENLEESQGTLAYLAEIARNTPSASNIVAYANIVRERHQLRRLAHIGKQLSDQALGADNDSQSLIEDTERTLSAVAERRDATSVELIPALEGAIDLIDRATNAPDGITGSPSGYADLDHMTAGWQNGDLIIMAARPSMGKTTLGMNLVENLLASKLTHVSNAPCFVFSLEMPRDHLMLRMIASIGQVDLQDLRNGDIEDDDWSKVGAATTILKGYEHRLYIDDTSDLTATGLKSRARRMARRYGKPALILVDYLQLLNEPGHENRNNEIAAISKILKNIARELRCPIIALAQLNRNLENRPNKRPTLADLRDSGGIEQDADIVTMIYRDEVYHPDNLENQGLAELIVAKHRMGPTGTVHLTFQSHRSRFESLERRYREGSA